MAAQRAGALVRAAEQMIIAACRDRVLIGVVDDNARAQQLYCGLGSDLTPEVGRALTPKPEPIRPLPVPLLVPPVGAPGMGGTVPGVPGSASVTGGSPATSPSRVRARAVRRT